MLRGAVAGLAATALLPLPLPLPLPLFPPGAAAATGAPPTIRANTNRAPAGELRNGVLTIHLEVRAGVWYPETEDGPGLVVLAFGEEGKAPEIPGPLIRVPEGTRIHATVRNRLAGASLVVHGWHTRPGSDDDTIQVAPGATRHVRFSPGAAGTYFYWGSTTGTPMVAPGGSFGQREGLDSQLAGALIVDAAGQRPPPGERVFVIGVWSEPPDTSGPRPTRGRKALAIDGRSYPYTEPLTYTVGDSVHWRWINTSDRPHPMHLHGFYYRVDSRGDAARDTVYTERERRLVVTERMRAGTTMSLAWAPNRPGNWIFHCHILFHISPELRLGLTKPRVGASSMEQMAGLVLALHVRPSRAVLPPPGAAREPRRLRLLVQSHPGRFGADPGYGFVLQEGSAEPAPDSVRIPGSPIVLTRGEPVRITVVNRLDEPTAVHWHGIELESYYDGVPGLSGDPGRLMPAIAPGDSFAAAFTPPRAGTFIYHTHIDDVRQLALGLYGPLVVLKPGQSFDPATDHTLLFSIGGTSDGAPVLLNGRTTPEPIELRAGVPQRFRLIAIPPAGGGDVMLFADTSLVSWRAIAKDGADLPPAQATLRPARQRITVGETYDFELTPAAPGDLRLELRNGPDVLVQVPVRVR